MWVPVAELGFTAPVHGPARLCFSGDIVWHFLVASDINVKQYLSPAASLFMSLKLVLVNEELRKSTCMYIVVNTMKVQVLQRQETLYPLHRHQDLGKGNFIEIRAQLYLSITDISSLSFSDLCKTGTYGLSFNRLVYNIKHNYYHKALIPHSHTHIARIPSQRCRFQG